jgi:hypothetical protein
VTSQAADVAVDFQQRLAACQMLPMKWSTLVSLLAASAQKKIMADRSVELP